ncbi:MAG: hypothetical protein LBK22_07755, partial [Tannerella sp.]|nr:hypothetical protein [Tannerella sp.]
VGVVYSAGALRQRLRACVPGHQKNRREGNQNHPFYTTSSHFSLLLINMTLSIDYLNFRRQR